MKTAHFLLRGIFVAALAAVLLTGCRSTYEITLTNGGKITARGKPRRVEGYYVYKDARGQPAEISAMRVRAVEVR